MNKTQLKKRKSIKIESYIDEYKDLVSFGSNKYQAFHRWYPFVEGYGSEFVRRIIGEQAIFPKRCLDPFGGVGTTILTCQELEIECHSVEPNPFLVEVAKTKLDRNYSSKKFKGIVNRIEKHLLTCTQAVELPNLESKTFFESEERKKWIFDREVAYAIVDILNYINKRKYNLKEHYHLLKLALASILLGVSNVYRNGKCLSYKRDWQKISITRKEVHQKFLSICKQVFLVDLVSKQNSKATTENRANFRHGDSRNELALYENDYFDIVITSPPYLNSRDYTDIYRLELWLLGHISMYKKEQGLRKSALTSHVQITLPETTYPDVEQLNEYIEYITNPDNDVRLWNRNIPNMIKGYFQDMKGILEQLYLKLKKGGKVYLNVSNSAYGGKVCVVDEILAEIAKKEGFTVDEIRIARYIGSSAQQKLERKMRESVIVLTK
ncbi:MAG: hypothetical protein ACRBFS_08140 [Aureispira sp.]